MQILILNINKKVKILSSVNKMIVCNSDVLSLRCRLLNRTDHAKYITLSSRVDTLTSRQIARINQPRDR